MWKLIGSNKIESLFEYWRQKSIIENKMFNKSIKKELKISITCSTKDESKRNEIIYGGN